MGDYALAAAWLRRSIALQTLAHNADPYQLAESLYNLGLLYLAQDDHMNAERFLLKALWRQRELLGETDPDTQETLASLQEVYCEQDVYAFVEAIPFSEMASGQPTSISERRKRKTSTDVAS